MNVEQAIKTAVGYVQHLFGGSDHRLEEVELKDDGGFEITVSFKPAGDASASVSFGEGSVFTGRKAAIGIDASRLYKDLTIDKDGAVRAVRMRQIVLG